MKTYDLYVESGPMMKKTMVHVPSLLGCTARGDTTDLAIEATPGAIRAYLGFLQRASERVDPNAAFRTRVVEHNTDGGFLGQMFLPTDHEPLLKRESDAMMRRLDALHRELRRITAALATKQLTIRPPKGRAIRQILQHVCTEGGYLRGVGGASRLQREVDEGRIEPLDALEQIFALELERLNTMSEEERSALVVRGQSPWTARSAVRHMLEHGWEHYVEIAERLGVVP